MQSGRDPIPLDAAWRLAVRVAFVASSLVAAVAIALRAFAHADALVLVFGTVLVGLAVGLSLPPARPVRPAWLPRPAPRSTVRLVPPPEH